MTEAENNSAPALSAHKVAVTSNGRQQPKMWTAENPVRHKCGRLGHSPPHVKLGLQTATKREFRPAETQTERQFASANCNGPTFGGSAVSERGLEPPRDNVSLGPQPGTVHPNQSHPVPIRPAYGAISTVSAGVHPIQSRPVPACWVAGARWRGHGTDHLSRFAPVVVRSRMPGEFYFMSMVALGCRWLGSVA